MLAFKKYEFKDLKKFLNDIKPNELPKVKKNKIEYYNIPVAFDIETSSFYESNIKESENKRGLMYAWVFGFNGLAILGRTWEEFNKLCDSISLLLELWEKRIILIYVHNLAYDFQFFRKHINVNKIFALSEREPLKVFDSTLGFEFRCSYKLSGYSLEKVGEHLTKYKVNKLVGDLDYSLIRSPFTPLSEKEKGYIYNDAFVVMAYIQEEIEKANNRISSIPLTKTGKIRNYCRNACYYGDRTDKYKFKNYRMIMKKLQITSELEYQLLKKTFMGGFTHANHNKSNMLLDNVHSFDFSSSYPAVMVAERFPMSRATKVNPKTKKEFEDYLISNNCIFKATFINICETFTYEHFISYSKCIEIDDPILDNGRIVRAMKLSIFLTELDFKIIKKTYKWDSLLISNMRIYYKGYLPKDFVNSILVLYAKKTELKGVEDKVIEYQESKENINGCYGMTVTDICRDEVTYNNEEWGIEPVNAEEKLNKYNSDIKRFLFYPWGIYVTAYARYNLWSGILALKEDYIYSDTDSLKFQNLEKHEEYFKRYNELMIKKLEKALKYHKLDTKLLYPKTIKGETKTLGLWDYEGKYTYFKTLGAKRYMFEKNGDINLVISGVNKKTAIPYLKEKYKTNLNIFNHFKDNLYIERGYTGKQTHTYIDEETNGIVKDYLGNYYNYTELSSIHLEESDYRLSLSEDYIKYILGYKIITY